MIGTATQEVVQGEMPTPAFPEGKSIDSRMGADSMRAMGAAVETEFLPRVAALGGTS
jgi:hypothetical protein